MCVSRVARNMLNSPGSSRSSRGNRGLSSSSVTGEELSMAKLLLENCVRLLRDSRHTDDINVRHNSPLYFVFHCKTAFLF